MTESNHKSEDFLITVNDCIKMLKRAKFKIIFGVFFFSLLMTLYSLMKPIQYKAEATFKEKSNSQVEVNSSSFAKMVFGGFPQENISEAKSMMLSRKLLQDVINLLNLQATITKKSAKSPLLRRIKDNLRIEYYALRKKIEPPLPDIQTAVEAKNVEYFGEILIPLKLVFDSEETYQVIGSKEEKLGNGKLGTPFSSRDFRFTIEKVQDFPLRLDTYDFTLSPLVEVTKTLSEAIDIEPDRNDETLLKLSYRNRARHRASEVLNQLMFTYQNYLRNEQNRISGEQIAYLHKREKEMGKNLKEVFETYANRISSDVSSVGYADSEAALNFLSLKMQEVKEKLLTIDLELKRQERLKQDNESNASFYHIPNAPKILNELITRMQELKNQSDSIELALHQSTRQNHPQREKIFFQQIIDLENMRQCSNDAKLIVSYLENNQYPLPQVPLLGDNQFMVKTWGDGLVERERELNNASASEREEKREDWKNFQSQFTTYLHHFIHFLNVREKTIQERLVHQQSSQLEFQGINLSTANNLYLKYSQELSNIEAQILQLDYIIDQLKKSGFEVSSLSAVITDSVTTDLVAKASEFVLALQDDANRSLKEKERLKTELETQKRFLDLHLQQTVQLFQLKENLLKDKIHSLQSASLELIQQQISILEKQMADTLDSNINHLKQEQQLIEQHQLNLRHEMALLPRQWVTEKLIEQQVMMNTTMMEELTKLVESKNITNHLEMVQSAPVDLSLPSAYPEKPKIIFFMTLGAFLGSFFSVGFVFARAMIKSLPASKDNLELSGVHVSGVMTKNHAENLQTRRRFIAHLDPYFPYREKCPQTLAFIKGEGDDYSRDIAKLLSKQRLTVLLLDLTFEKEPESEQLPGIFQYLEGKVDTPKIHHFAWYDTISSGGVCDFSNERMGSRIFCQLVDHLKTQYDWVIGITNASPVSPEVENFINFFDHTLINIYQETRRDLNHVIQLAKQISPKKKVSFIIFDF